MDIYRQLRLFLDNTDHGLNIEPVNLEDYFHNARLWLEYRVDDENYRADFAEWERNGSEGFAPGSQEGQAHRSEGGDRGQVLSSVFIRRRRKDIKDLYGDTAEVGGKPVHFPDPVLDNMDYRLDKVYAKGARSRSWSTTWSGTRATGTGSPITSRRRPRRRRSTATSSGLATHREADGRAALQAA